MERAQRAAFGLVGVAAALLAWSARADEAPSAERIKSAAEEFDVGRRAYLAGDYAEAAVHFENAYHDAPRPEPLRSAIRARRLAHEDARAASLASLAAIRYGTDATTMQLANETLSELSPKLLGVNLACDPACGVAADGRVISVVDAKQAVFYLAPGTHELIVSWPGDRSKTIAIEGGAGSVKDLTLKAPEAKPAAAPASAPAPASAAASASGKPLSPVVFGIGAGLTAIGIGATIVSGIAAQNDPGKDAVLRDCVGQGTSCPTYQRGKSAELRTDVILGATGAVALGTAVVGVFFTQWSKPRTQSARFINPYAALGPGGACDIGVRGAF